MDKKVKKLWTKALKSGEYKQGRSCLNDAQKFCCLGVLCDLHAKAMKKKSFKEDGTYLKAFDLLPKQVTTWAKFTDKELEEYDVNYDVTVGTTDLTTLNDGGKDFDYIAEQIEKHL